MLHESAGNFVELDLAFKPSADGGALFLYQREEDSECWLTMIGHLPPVPSSGITEVRALVTVSGVEQSIFGYPNEEAYWQDPRGGLEWGFYELVGSVWSEKLAEYNLRTYGPTQSSFGSSFEGLRHFFVGSKDASAQFLAREITAEVFDLSFDVQGEAVRRMTRGLG
jgi:hypothetical protein